MKSLKSTNFEETYFIAPPKRIIINREKLVNSTLTSQSTLPQTIANKVTDENIIAQQSREIDKLKKLNQFLLHSVDQRQDLLAKERQDRLRLKSLLSNNPPHPASRQISKNKRNSSLIEFQQLNKDQTASPKKLTFFENPESPTKSRSTQKTMTYFQKLISIIPSTATSEKNEKQEPIKDEPKQFLSVDETLKLHAILDMNLTDEEAIGQYDSDANIRFNHSLLGDEDRFIKVLEQSSYQKISFIFEKLKKLLNEHRQFFMLVLRMKALIRAAFQITRSLDLDEALEKIVQSTAVTLECDRSSCFVTDQAKGELWSKVAKGLSTVIRFPMDKGVAGHVATSRETVNIINAYSDYRFNKDVDSKTNYKTKSILACPIVEQDNCLGVLQCINKNQGHFSKQDEALLKILCDFCQIVLKNTMNSDQQLMTHNRLRQTIRCGIALQSLYAAKNLKNMLQMAEKQLKSIMATDQVRIAIKLGSESMFYDEEGEKQIVNLQTGLLNQCIQTSKHISIFNASKNPHFSPLIDIETSLPVICKPVKLGGSTLGAIMVVNVKGLATIQKLTY